MGKSDLGMAFFKKKKKKSGQEQGAFNVHTLGALINTYIVHSTR